MKCPICETENEGRNYYCIWCGHVLKDRAAKKKKLKYRYDYLFDLPIVEDDSNDRDSFLPYRSKGSPNEK